MHESKEEALELGGKHLVSISSRISLDASKMLTEIQGWLQTESEYAKISKQEAFERAIRFYHAYILQALDNRDREVQAESKQIVSIHKKQEEKQLQIESEEERKERERQAFLKQYEPFRASGTLSFSNFNFNDYKNNSRQ